MHKKIAHCTLAFTPILLFISGCTPHLSKQQCSEMNWRQIGYSDAIKGKNQRDLSTDIKSCAQFNITVNMKDYRAGWQAGARYYCRPDKAYGMGLRGGSYNHICPAGLAIPFERAYRRGLRRYCVAINGYNLGKQGKPMPTFCAADQAMAFANAYREGKNIFDQVGNLSSQIASVDNQISQLKQAIKNNNNAISQAKVNSAKEKNPSAQASIISSNYKTIDRFKQKNNNLQTQINLLQKELNSLQQQLSVIQKKD